jgi:catechol 2,3-dioxygenase-like lactoylglutathione lyase family enzyme
MTTGIHHVAVCTADLDALEQFYEHVFGSDVWFDRIDGPFRHALLQLGDGGGVHAFELPEHAGPPETAGPIANHFAVAATDEACFTAARERAMECGGGPCDIVDYGVMLACNIVDPDGVSIELCLVRPDVPVEDMTPPRPVAA